jgi:hypothetical protein
LVLAQNRFDQQSKSYFRDHFALPYLYLASVLVTAQVLALVLVYQTRQTLSSDLLMVLRVRRLQHPRDHHRRPCRHVGHANSDRD